MMMMMIHDLKNNNSLIHSRKSMVVYNRHAVFEAAIAAQCSEIVLMESDKRHHAALPSK